MKLLNLTGRVMMVAVVVVGLGACSKKKNGSVAATPASVCTLTANGTYINAQGLPCSPTANQCIYNGATQSYTNQLGQPCSPQSTCTLNAQGQYRDQLGQACVPYPQVPNYPHQPGGQQYGCQQWTYQYGVQYVPVYLQGGLQCVRIDLLQSASNYPPQYYDSGYYEYGYDYYYAYPPYSGSGCSTQIDFGGSWGSVGICF